jgi:hypothetical protein
VMNNPRGMPRVYHPYVTRRGGAGGVTILLNLCYKQVILNSKLELAPGRKMLCEIFLRSCNGAWLQRTRPDPSTTTPVAGVPG